MCSYNSYQWCDEDAGNEYTPINRKEQDNNRELLLELLDALYKLNDGEEINSEFVSEKLEFLARSYEISYLYNFSKPLDICRKSLAEKKQDPYFNFCIELMKEQYPKYMGAAHV